MRDTVADTRSRLRDLDDDAFHGRYGCDRFTATVLTSRFRYVAAHMANQVRAHSFSGSIRLAADLTGMISGPPELGFPLAAVSETMPLFYGSATDSVRIVLQEYGLDDLRPGDVLIVNDYYRVGTHLNDVCLVKPLFHAGQLTGAVTIRAHFTDVGGTVLGGLVPDKTTTWEDGLRIPPMLLCAGGSVVKSTLRLIYANTRLGYLSVPDLITELHALELGESLIAESIDRYGPAAYAGAVRYACDAAAESMDEALRQVPDGVYDGSAAVDGDGLPDSPEYTVRVRVTKAGGRAELDFRGSSPSTRSALNCAWPDIKTGVSMALKFLIDQRTPVNSGTFRPIDIVVPPDALFNAPPPKPCSLYFAPIATIVRAVFDALNRVLGPDAVATSFEAAQVVAYGLRPDGNFGSLVNAAGPTILGPWGATRHGDGDSGQQGNNGNLVGGGVELFELAGPAVWLSTDYVPDSGGPGTNRGGASNVHDVMWRCAAEHRTQLLFHSRVPGAAVHGGRPGPATAVWLFDGDISSYGTVPPELPSTLDDPVYQRATPVGGVIDPVTHQADLGGEYVMLTERLPRAAGAVARVVTSAGGGWGDPWHRDPRTGAARCQGRIRDRRGRGPRLRRGDHG